MSNRYGTSDVVREPDDVEAAVLVGEPDLPAFGNDPRLGAGVAAEGSPERGECPCPVASRVVIGDLAGLVDVSDVEDP